MIFQLFFAALLALLPFPAYGESPGFNPDFGCTLQTDLIADWKLEEASGTRLDELNGCGGTGCDLTDNNTVTQAAGKQGNAGQFTRANTEYLSRADHADLSTGNISATWAVWVYLDTNTDAEMNILNQGWSGGTESYKISYTGGVGDEKFTFAVSNAPNEATVTNTGVAATATWHLIIAWHDANADTINLQRNNGAVSSVSFTFGMADSGSAFHIGALNGLTSPWNGRIDEPAFWKRILTAQERSDLYAGGVGNTYNGANVCLSSFVRRYNDANLH